MAIRAIGRLGTWVLVALLPGASLQAQAPLFLVNPSTEVASVDFQFTSGRSFERDFLRSRIALTDRGALAGLRERLDFLPLITAPADHPFDPVTLQRDLIRLRRLYAESGFLASDIRYDVQLDTTSNTVDVRFVIDEGRSVVLEELEIEVASGDSSAQALPTDLEEAWSTYRSRLRRDYLGRRLGPAQERGLQDRSGAWFRDRGYPNPSVSSDRVVDSTRATATARLTISPGVRRRFGSVSVEGNERISNRVLARELPITQDQWFSASAVAEGEREVYGLDMVRWADAVVQDGAGTGPVPVRVQVQEGPLRLISGQVGYSTSAGLTTEASWAHRNFLGGARVLSVTAEARTGLLAADETSEERYGLSTTLRQPYLGSRRMSGLLTPFVEYRDGPIDESFRNGIDATAVYELGGISTLALQYRIAARKVLQYRFGTLTDSGLDFLELQTILDDSVGTVTRESRLTASGTWGRLDDRVRPRRGLVARLGLQGAGPDVLSDVQFAKVTSGVSAFLPLGGDFFGRLRLSGGRLWPLGKSIPSDPDAGLIRFLELRDALLTAGGTGDVRGWADGLLGPKTPDFRTVDRGDSLSITADRFIPVGGLSKTAFALELAFNLPAGLRRHAGFLFLDGGRIWTDDGRFGIGDPYDQERMFFGTGAGIEFMTAVGPVRIALGYKLNPSPLDLRDPTLVQRALNGGLPISTVPTEALRRFQLHIDLGNAF